VHADTFDAVEYFPLPHGVQVVAPVDLPVFVIDPAGHSVQAVTLDVVEYFPLPHGVQEVAPGDAPVFVIEPASQTVQFTAPEKLKRPARQ